MFGMPGLRGRCPTRLLGCDLTKLGAESKRLESRRVAPWEAGAKQKSRPCASRWCRGMRVRKWRGFQSGWAATSSASTISIISSYQKSGQIQSD